VKTAPKIATAAALAAAASLLAVAPSSAAGSYPATARSAASHPVSSLTRQEAANKALVSYVYDQMFNDFNTSVIDKYVRPDYIQHNPTVANGSDALRALVESLPPDSHHTVEHVIADGDLVLFQTDLVITPGTKGLATIDVFRVQNGKIAEHWDTLQQEPEQTASGNDMFATLTSPRTSATSTTANTALSRAVVLAYFTGLTKHRDLSAVDRYVAPDLVQHDPALADGAAATKAAYAQRFKADPGFTATVASVVAEGDYVVVHSHYRNSAGDLGQSVYEIFRVRHGKIVEHWSDTQDVPATSANGNTMF
jgi:predicted SnoaL-like aldol condensation-catalyzing enzyme